EEEPFTSLWFSSRFSLRSSRFFPSAFHFPEQRGIRYRSFLSFLHSFILFFFARCWLHIGTFLLLHLLTKEEQGEVCIFLLRVILLSLRLSSLL
ncbi:hypothetical protein CSUI_010702, partial [Cystoisospora suis]